MQNHVLVFGREVFSLVCGVELCKSMAVNYLQKVINAIIQSKYGDFRFIFRNFFQMYFIFIHALCACVHVCV